MKVEATIHFGKQGRKKQAQKAKPPVVGRTTRIAKLMALAIRFEVLIADGTVSDYFGTRRIGSGESGEDDSDHEFESAGFPTARAVAVSARSTKWARLDNVERVAVGLFGGGLV